MKEYQDEWISAENLLHLIQHHMELPNGVCFNVQRLNLAISTYAPFKAAEIH